MADCVISGTLYKTVGASSSETLNSFTFYVSKGLLSGSGIGQSKVAITTHASNGTFSFAAQQGELIRVTGDFVVGDYSFKDGLELFVPVAGTASFTSLKTPRDYVRALTTTTGNAPNDATYILQTADADLANAQALGALATGILKNTTSTGVLSIATAGTDYLPSINGLTADASPDGAADYVVTYDASASAHKKVLLNNLPGGGGGSVSSVFGRTGAVTAASNDYTWAQIDKTTSSLADITTRSASDLSSGTLAAARGGAGTVNGILKADGAGLVSAAASGTDYAPATSGTAILKGNGSGGFSNAAAGTDYEVPLTFSTGLTRSTNTITVNTSQNIATLSNLTSNGLVTTSGGAGTLGVTVPGTGVLTALGVNVGSAGAVVLFNGDAGTPSSLTLTNATGLPLSTGVTGDLPFANFVQAGSAGFVGATGAGDYSHRTPTQVTAALDAFVGDSGSGGTKGLVPAPASGDAAANKYLKADGTWATVAASSGITIGTTAITSGTDKRLLYDDSGVVGETAGFEYQAGASPNVLITAQNASYTALTVSSAASPSVDIMKVQNNGTDRFGFRTDGLLQIIHTGGIRVDGGASGYLVENTTPMISWGNSASNLHSASGVRLSSNNRGVIFITAATVTEAGYPCLSITGTWNASGVTHDGIKLNITNTASAAGSKLLDLQIGGASRFKVDKDGVVQISNATAPSASVADAGLLFNADINAGAGNAGLHFRNEINTAALILPGVRYKTDTGDPTDLFEGMVVINTFDNTAKIYADGALRTIATW